MICYVECPSESLAVNGLSRLFGAGTDQTGSPSHHPTTSEARRIPRQCPAMKADQHTHRSGVLCRGVLQQPEEGRNGNEMKDLHVV